MDRLQVLCHRVRISPEALLSLVTGFFLAAGGKVDYFTHGSQPA
jgi:hypothetical protein